MMSASHAPTRRSPVTRWLQKAPPAAFALYGGFMAFGVYFAMYAFRKPFAVASYDGPHYFGIDFKTLLLIAQILGYALSKLAGIRIISELEARWRALSILALIAVSEMALFAFSTVPAPYKILCLFMNGLPLGLIWGLVFGFLEGRRTSEILSSILCASFIVSSGVVKSVGKWLMIDYHLSDFNMPFVTGLVFTPLLIFCLWGLSQLPPPDDDDVTSKSARLPMNHLARRALFKDYAPGLIGLVFIYILLTALRDFRDNFAAEIWAGLGYGAKADVFATSELPVGAIVLAAMAFIALFKSNRAAVLANFSFVALGLFVAGASTLAMMLKSMDPYVWMITLGAGLYLAYTPFNAILFDRLMAATGRVGTAGFLIYVADTAGYSGSVALMLFRSLSSIHLPWVTVLQNYALTLSIMGLGVLFYVILYFRKKI